MPILFREGFLLFLSAALLVLPFHFGALGPLAFFALVPAFFCLKDKTSFQVFKCFFVMGFIYYAALGYWLNYVNVLGFLVLCAYLSLYFSFFGIWARPFLVFTKFRNGFFVAAIWVLLEYLRGALLSGFPWALLGYSQWKILPLIQIADLGGAYGVSFFILCVNVWVFQIVRSLSGGSLLRPPFPRRQLTGLVSGFILVAGYGWISLNGREAFYRDPRPKAEIRVSVLQGNIPQEKKWDARIKNIIFEKYKRLMQMAAMERPDLVVWPETSFPGYLEDEALMASRLRALVRQSHTSALVGAPTLGDLEKELRFYNSAVLFGPSGEDIKRYHKEQLVPFGEYVPLEPFLGFLRYFVSIGHFNPGQGQGLFSIVSQYRPIRIAAKFSTLICYEDIFPELVRERCRAGADFLVNISNDAWFGKTTAPYQHAQASIFRAVENRVPVVRATNTGYSCFISAEGRVLSSVKNDGQEIMVSGLQTETLVLRKGRSIYTRFGGDLFFWLMVGLAVLGWREKQKQSGHSRI